MKKFDHTFTVRDDSHYWLEAYKEARGIYGGIKFCKKELQKQIGKLPNGDFKLRVASEKPDDDEVQWWKVNYRVDHLFMIEWADDARGPKFPNPKSTLLMAFEKWVIKTTNIKQRDGIQTAWVGAWEEV